MNKNKYSFGPLQVCTLKLNRQRTKTEPSTEFWSKFTLRKALKDTNLFWYKEASQELQDRIDVTANSRFYTLLAFQAWVEQFVKIGSHTWTCHASS